MSEDTLYYELIKQTDWSVEFSDIMGEVAECDGLVYTEEEMEEFVQTLGFESSQYYTYFSPEKFVDHVASQMVNGQYEMHSLPDWINDKTVQDCLFQRKIKRVRNKFSMKTEQAAKKDLEKKSLQEKKQVIDEILIEINERITSDLMEKYKGVRIGQISRGTSSILTLAKDVGMTLDSIYNAYCKELPNFVTYKQDVLDILKKKGGF